MYEIMEGMEEHTEIICGLVRNITSCETYLELGISHGYTVHYVKQARRGCRCIGVDIRDMRKFNDFEFYNMTTDDFFKNFNDGVDVVFIDADHEFEQCKKDFVNSLNLLNKYGVIVMDDTDPRDKGFTRRELCADSYKMVDWIISNYPDLNVFPIPISVKGITLVNRKKDRRIYEYVE